MLPINMTLERSYPTPYAASPWLYLILASMALQDHTPKTKSEIKDEYDYIIVGSGTAGSVLANRLSEKNCVTVLLLEAGKAPPKVSDIPAIATKFIYTDIDWKYQTENYTFADGTSRTIFLPSGKTIGGTSIFNGMQYVRGNKKNYDKWAADGASGWSYDEVLPYFKKLEDNTDPKYVKKGFHATGGPLTVSRPHYTSELKVALFEALRSMNYRIGDINGPVQEGFFDLQAAMRKGQRCSNAKAYLVPAQHRRNLDIVCNAFVRKVAIKDGEAEGVFVDFQGKSQFVRARKEVILSAGTIRSPQLLMLSGIGPSEELSKHGIKVEADLPVGLNLQEHWGTMMTFKMNSTLKPFYEKIISTNSIRKYMLYKEGPMSSVTGVPTYGFLHSQNGSTDAPLYQIIFGEESSPPKLHSSIYAGSCNKYGSQEKDVMFWCLPMVVEPKGRGFVALRSTDPMDNPVIKPNYFEHPEDVDTVVEGLKKCSEIASTNAMKKIGSVPFSSVHPGCEKYIQDEDKYLKCVAHSVVLSAAHLVGTVKMGAMEDKSAVLDPELKVKNIGKLRVVDASVMPSITTGNTNIPTTMIAEKASDIIKKDIVCEANNELNSLVDVLELES